MRQNPGIVGNGTVTTSDRGPHAPQRDGQPLPPPSSPTMSVSVVRTAAELELHLSAWNDLATHALEPNVYHEPWLMLPALRSFGAGKDLLFVLVYRSRPQGSPLLCGFFPLERKRSYKSLPVSCLSSWDHHHGTLSMPLLHRDHARECVAAFLDWLAKDPQSAALIEFPLLAGEGPVFQTFLDQFRQRRSLTLITESFTRAFLRCRADAETYLRASLTTKRLREMERRHKRLAELGKLEYVVLTQADDVEKWLSQFVQMEAAGWKGQQGTALACSEEDRRFFFDMARQAFARGQWLMYALHLNGQPIGFWTGFLSPPGAFSFKPTYDENYSRFSPGVLLEIEILRHIHSRADIDWLDSCTSPDNELLNGLWLERRIIHNLVAATGKGSGGLTLSTLPILRWLKRTVGGWRRSRG